jgi:hypothetical protein
MMGSAFLAYGASGEHGEPRASRPLPGRFDI